MIQFCGSFIAPDTDTIVQRNKQHNRNVQFICLHGNHGQINTLHLTLANGPQQIHCQGVNSEEEKEAEAEKQREQLAQALADEWQGVRPHEDTIYVRVA